MKLFLNFILSAILAFVILLILPGLTTNYWTAAFVALVLGIINISIRPLLALLSIIPTFVTIIVSLFFMNGVIVVLADWMIDSFTAENIWFVVLFSGILAVANWGIHRLVWR